MATWLLDRLMVIRVACVGVREHIRTSGGAGLIELEAAAAVRWELGGKRAVLLRRRALAAEEATAARLAAQAAAFKSYMAQGGTALAGLSGRLLQPIGEVVRVAVGACGRTGKRRAGTQGSRACAPPSDFQIGAAPNRHGQWRTDRVLEVQRVRCTRRQAAAANVLTMRIRWHGLDPACNLPWRDSWRPLFDEAGCTVSPGLRADVEAMAAIKYGAKAPRRAAGQVQAAAGAARAAPRWTRSPVRMRKRAAADAQAAAPLPEADADVEVIHTCRVPHVMFQRRVLRDVAGDEGAAGTADATPAERRAAQASSDAAFLALQRDEYEDDGAGLFGDWPTRRAAALRRWAPEDAPSAGPSADGGGADAGSSDASVCYDSGLDGSCDGLGWSDDEELVAAWAAARDDGGRDADGG